MESIRDYRIRKLEEVRKMLLGKKYPPTFQPQLWRNVVFANCYAYALDLPVEDERHNFWFPGCISDPTCDRTITSQEELLSRLHQDLDLLGFQYQEANSKKITKEFLITVYEEEKKSDQYSLAFHFTRRDANEIWSHKPSWLKPVRRGNYFNGSLYIAGHPKVLQKLLITKK